MIFYLNVGDVLLNRTVFLIKLGRWEMEAATCSVLPPSRLVCASVTTVPLSVSYWALNLLVRVDASNFVPYACDRAVTGGECEGPEVPHRCPLFPVVAWQQNGRTVLQRLSHLYFPSLGWSKCWGPMLALYPFFL